MTQKHHQLYGYTKFIILGVLILAGLLANGSQSRLMPDQAEGLMNASAPTLRDTIKRYFPDEAVIDGLMANAEHESRLDPTSFEYKPVWGKGDEQGYGLFQFTGQQLTDYVNWLESNQTQDSADAQLQFVHANIYTNSQGTAGPHDIGGEARDQLQNDFNSGDPGRIARSFAINYEKMADQGQPDARSTTANAYFPDRRRTKPTASKPDSARNMPTEPNAEPPLSLGGLTGYMTTEGRPAYHNNFGGMSTEYSIGTKNPKINNGLLTHIPSIYDGQIVDQRTAEDMVIQNQGYDPETGRFITPGGDPEARSKNLELIKNTARKPFPPGTYSGNDANMTLIHPGPKNLIR